MSVMMVTGRLGRSAELRYTSSGTAVADLAVAYDYGRKGNDGKRPTQWVRASLWGQQAESLVPYLEKGKGVVLVLDDAHIREYDKNDGTKGHSLEGRVIKFEFAPSSRDSGAQNQNYAPQNQQAQPQTPQKNYQADMGGMGNMVDDIPFNAYFARNAYAI